MAGFDAGLEAVDLDAAEAGAFADAPLRALPGDAAGATETALPTGTEPAAFSGIVEARVLPETTLDTGTAGCRTDFAGAFVVDFVAADGRFAGALAAWVRLVGAAGAAFFATTFFVTAFLATTFFATAFFATAFPAAAFFVATAGCAAFFTAADRETVFFATTFFATAFFATAFLAGATFLAAFAAFFAGFFAATGGLSFSSHVMGKRAVIPCPATRSNRDTMRFHRVAQRLRSQR